ncbi:unnamed protein product, partial [Iphiclides podalirius]
MASLTGGINHRWKINTRALRIKGIHQVGENNEGIRADNGTGTRELLARFQPTSRSGAKYNSPRIRYAAKRKILGLKSKGKRAVDSAQIVSS